MSDTELNTLRATILRFFLTDGAQQTADFLALPEVRRHNRRQVRRIIHGMAAAGLLDQWGRTSGSWFLTNHLGYVVLATLEHEYLHPKGQKSNITER